ncbi:MAG: S-layer homology domain-containing protein, partial [Oscillospiraceae bacterium]|nr:S-layer homology domain-containing protein [Oscillospiraceae bacterium]
ALSLAVSASAANPGLENFTKALTYTPGQYADVPATHTFSENAKAAYEYNIMQGYGTTFGVSSNITRLASIIIACRLNCIYYNGVNNINDTYTGSTQEKHIAYATDHGIFCDFGDVSQPATRAEFAAILSSAFPDEALAAINTVADNGIPDVTMDMTHADAIYRLYRAGIINGSDAVGTFYPTSNINRGAACAIATRMCDTALRKSVDIPTDYPTRLKEAVAAVTAAYISATQSLNSCAKELGKKDNADAFSYYQPAAANLALAASLCSSHAALKDIKTHINHAADALYNSIPASYNVNSHTFFMAMYNGVQKALPFMQKAAPLLSALSA